MTSLYSANDRDDLPVAVIGAGPIGLAAAANLAEQGIPWVLFETGAQVGASVLEWGHVPMFSPWSSNVDAVSLRLLDGHGWQAPDPASHPTGEEFVDRYLAPLAAVPDIAKGLELASVVRAVSREGADKVRGGPLRDAQPFVLTVVQGSSKRRVRARAVIDASGTWGTANPLGADGLPAAGERDAADVISYRIPDVLGRQRARYAGRSVVVVGSGHSAQNVLRDLAILARQEAGTRIHWAVRRDGRDILDPPPDQQLPARGQLQAQARELVTGGAVELVTGFWTDRVSREGARVVLHGSDRRLGPVDEVIASTGFRPDLKLLRELRLDLDPALESARSLAPLIDPDLHNCATVPAHGADELRHPEQGVYVVGMKSYGRAPTFLTATGYEQVRSVVAEIAGDAQVIEQLATPSCCGPAVSAAATAGPTGGCGGGG